MSSLPPTLTAQMINDELSKLGISLSPTYPPPPIQMINDELSKQGKLVEHIDNKTDKTQDRIEQMNTKSQV